DVIVHIGTRDIKNVDISVKTVEILRNLGHNFRLVVIEALACGTPAIVSEAIPDEVVINGFNGFRVRSFNPDDYAKALLKIFENNDEWYRISKNAVEFSKQFDHIEIAKRYLSLISTSESLF
ncbi:MAG: glycosyltransferase, partial [Archaeoglobaceae archaeon]